MVCMNLDLETILPIGRKFCRKAVITLRQDVETTAKRVYSATSCSPILSVSKCSYWSILLLIIVALKNKNFAGLIEHYHENLKKIS